MITIMITTNLMITIMFTMMNHPLSMGLMLLMQTITVSLITGNMNQNMWFSYILFLIMVGGMLILFMYMTSIASNEKFKTNLKISSITIIIPIIMFIIYPFSKTIIKNNETIPFNQSIELMESLNKYINIPLSMTTVFMMIYLLLALIATVKITNFKQGSIRQMN
uniref:NADH-ubiquinone oxidoreductase chain 6 n=1 Tax=Alphitobius diaperinus TaxID=27448 RepID=A0A6M8PVM8_ALPDA|nr:NADH dehydrogenase subunit 6 [Alphitobius diaperinus]QKI32134.1 NADH dehydrogenase subunit 6 [Alphitobius diaperinus]QNK05476.1 NADH dehydrogenase subunit 6 [Alphitobius diaperinus]